MRVVSGLGINPSRLCRAAVRVAMLGLLFTSVARAQESNKAQQAQPGARDEDCQQVRKSLQQLSAEVSKLRAEVAKLQRYQQVDYLRDLITKEENRIQAAHKELTEMGDKEIALQKRLDEVEAELRPDRIQQSLAGVGSMRPEQERESIEQRLNNEKRRIQAQLDQFRQNRPRLQTLITSAEASIVTLRQRLRDAQRATGLRGND